MSDDAEVPNELICKHTCKIPDDTPGKSSELDLSYWALGEPNGCSEFYAVYRPKEDKETNNDNTVTTYPKGLFDLGANNKFWNSAIYCIYIDTDQHDVCAV